MRRAVILAVALVFAIAFLARAMTYTVRFSEKAVLTTFGKAGPESVKPDPGLMFKWPDPIQSVTKYDTRSRFLQAQAQTQQTADSRQLVVEAFCTWRVSDPLLFFQRFSNAGDRAQDHYKAAENALRNYLRAAMGETSAYRMDELFTTDAKKSKLPELEGKIKAALQATQNDRNTIADYGIMVDVVGINQIILPEETTKAVFESMKTDREYYVKELESKGASEAQTITGTAKANADRIEAFARALAADIRQKGDLEAQSAIAAMGEAPELAVFLKEIDFLKLAMAKRITWIVDTKTPGFELMTNTPGSKPRVGGVPGVSGLMTDPTGSMAGREPESKTVATPGTGSTGGR